MRWWVFQGGCFRPRGPGIQPARKAHPYKVSASVARRALRRASESRDQFGVRAGSGFGRGMLFVARRSCRRFMVGPRFHCLFLAGLAGIARTDRSSQKLQES